MVNTLCLPKKIEIVQFLNPAMFERLMQEDPRLISFYGRENFQRAREFFDAYGTEYSRVIVNLSNHVSSCQSEILGLGCRARYFEELQLLAIKNTSSRRELISTMAENDYLGIFPELRNLLSVK